MYLIQQTNTLMLWKTLCGKQCGKLSCRFNAPSPVCASPIGGGGPAFASSSESEIP